MAESKGQGHSLTQRLVEGFERRGDVTFSVGESGHEEEIKAFACILCISSPVFDTMFNSTWNDQREIIRLPDVRPDIFRCFLKLLVTDDLKGSHIEALKLSVEGIFMLLYLAKKYEVNFVQSVCSDHLKSNLTMDTSHVALIYEFARLFHEPDVEDEAFAFISTHAADVFNSEAFLKLSKESLTLILKSDDLVIDEVFLFKRICRWAEVQCVYEELAVTGENLRKVLGELLFLIRFPLISPSDFAKFIRPTKILSSAEMLGLYDYFAISPSERGTFKVKRIPFGDSPRNWRPKPPEQPQVSTPTQQRLRRTIMSSPSLNWLFK